MSEGVKRSRGAPDDDEQLARRLDRELKGLPKAEKATQVLIDAKRYGKYIRLFAPGDPAAVSYRKGLNAVVNCQLCGWAACRPDGATYQRSMTVQAPEGKELDALGYHIAVYMRSEEVPGEEDVRYGIFHGTCAKAIRAWAADEHSLETLIEATQHLLGTKTCAATIKPPEQETIGIEELVAKRQKSRENG